MKLDSDVLDRSQALAAVGGDTEFLAELAGIFEAACPTLLERIERAFAAGDLAAAASAARLLRVVAQNVAARRVVGAALEFEMLARQTLVDGAQEAYRVLLQEVEWLKPELGELACSEYRSVILH